MGVENGDEIVSLAAIFRLRALRCSPLTECIVAQFFARVQRDRKRDREKYANCELLIGEPSVYAYCDTGKYELEVPH